MFLSNNLLCLEWENTKLPYFDMSGKASEDFRKSAGADESEAFQAAMIKIWVWYMEIKDLCLKQHAK